MHVRFFTHRKWCWTTSLGKARQMVTSYPWRTHNNRTKWPQSRLRQVLGQSCSPQCFHVIRYANGRKRQTRWSRNIWTQASHKNKYSSSETGSSSQRSKGEFVRSFLRFQVNKWARCKLPEVLLHLSALILAPLVQKTQDALLKGLCTLILRKLQRKRGKVNNRRDALKHCLHIQVFIMCLQDLDFLFVLNNQLWVQWRGLKLYYHNVYTMVHHLCTD